MGIQISRLYTTDIYMYKEQIIAIPLIFILANVTFKMFQEFDERPLRFFGIDKNKNCL
jgi:hypothetical protein